MPAVWQAVFFREKSRKCAVPAVYKKKNCDFSPRHVAGGNPAKGQNLEAESVKVKLKGTFPQRHVAGDKSFPSDMSLGNLLPPWHQFLDQKIRGAHFSLGIVAGERFAIELNPSTFPQRHVAGDIFPQRHVAGERVGMLLGKASNVVA
ncbi:hypothetical protein Tco_0916126 [Tanacetum coccineum]